MTKFQLLLNFDNKTPKYNKILNFLNIISLWN